MKFIEPSYKILSTDFTRDNVINTIAKAARTCYQSEPKSEDANVNLVKNLIKRGHEAMLEHAPLLSVVFTTCRGVSHELVRHRLFSFAHESTRYVRYGKNKEPMLFIIPPWIKGKDRELLLTKEFDTAKNMTTLASRADQIFIHSCTRAERNYADLLSEGWAPQEAREVLPNSVKTEIVVTGNVREWRHFFQLRCDKFAHPQMRELVIPLFLELKADIPEIWEDITDRVTLSVDERYKNQPRIDKKEEGEIVKINKLKSADSSDLVSLGITEDFNEVYIIKDDSEKTPHFHFKECSNFESFSCCIKLESPEYLSKDQPFYLNRAQKGKLIDYLMKQRGPKKITNWEALLALWNENNPDTKVDEHQKMPDYLVLQ